jgi:phage baseplate assembly protein W
LGRGWAFPPRLGPGGDVALVSAEEDIRQAIRVILETTPGERPMRPDFGVGLRALVFAPLSRGTISLVQFRVEQALTLWEPRVEVRQVDVRVDPDRPAVLLIGIRYLVRQTNSFDNLVYPFYLTESRRS